MSTEALYETPLGNFIDRLMDADRQVFIAGFTADHRSALVVDADNDRVSVADVESHSSLGRYECSKAHWQHYAGLYGERFPVR